MSLLKIIIRDLINKKYFLKCFTLFLFCFILISIQVGLIILYNESKQQILDESISINCFSSEAYDEPNLDSEEKYDNKYTFYQVTSNNFGMNVDIYIEDEKITKINSIFSYGVDYDKKDFFPSNIIREYNIKSNEELLYGKYPEKDNEILISKSIVKKMGLSNDDVIGKKITFKGGSSSIYANQEIGEGIVTGIISNDLSKVSFYRTFSDFFFSSINLPKKEFASRYYYTYLFLDNYNNISQSQEELGNNYTYMASGQFQIVGKIENIGKTIIGILLFLTLGIVVSILAIIVNLMFSFENVEIENRKTLRILGLEKGKVILIQAIEYLVILLLAVLLTISFMVIIYPNLVGIFENISGTIIYDIKRIKNKSLISTALICFSCTFLIFILFFLFSRFIIKKQIK